MTILQEQSAAPVTGFQEEAFYAEPKHLGFPIADLHCHYSTAVSPKELWDIHRDMGYKIMLGGKRIEDSRVFERAIRIDPAHSHNMTEYFETVYHPVLNKLTTGVLVAERAFEKIFSGAYMNGVDIAEVRTNPMKHNGPDEFDLDDLIQGMIDGMQTALGRHKKLGGGIIFCLAREWTNLEDPEEAKKARRRHEIIVEKAIAFHGQGVVGLDIAGPDDKYGRAFPVDEYVDLFNEAKKAGLGITVHSGETAAANDIGDMLKLNPDRIGHGILAAQSPRTMAQLRERGTVLEVCPSSNIALRNAKDWVHAAEIFNTLVDNDVKVTLSTDWPEIIRGARLVNQYRLLHQTGRVSVDNLRLAAQIGMDASFVKQPGRYPHRAAA